MESTAALAQNEYWSQAIEEIGLLEDDTRPRPRTLAIFFASPEHAHMDDLVDNVWKRTAASVLIGCTGQGIVGSGQEVEGTSALSLLNLMLPGVQLTPRHVEFEEIQQLGTPESWRQWVGLRPDQVNAWIALVDPFTFDAELLIEGLMAAYPGAPIVGGLASGVMNTRGTKLFVDGQVYTSGAIILALGGAYTVQTRSSRRAQCPSASPGRLPRWSRTCSARSAIALLCRYSRRRSIASRSRLGGG